MESILYHKFFIIPNFPTDVIIHCPSILTCPFKEIPAIREDECKKSSVSKESEQPRGK